MARKTQYETIRGKIFWAKTKAPNKFGKWSVDIYPDPASMAKINKLKETPAIKNVIKQNEDGKYISFHRDTSKLVRGKLVKFNPPIVLQRNPDGVGDPIPYDGMIGNGSDGDVELEIYGWDANPERGTLPGRAARLNKILVWNLIPFELKRDFTEQEFDEVSGLIKQPPMPQW